MDSLIIIMLVGLLFAIGFFCGMIVDAQAYRKNGHSNLTPTYWAAKTSAAFLQGRHY